MKQEFTLWQRRALTHPHDVDTTDEPDPACMHLPAKGRSVILTCDIDTETAQAYGGTGVARLGLAAEPDARRSCSFRCRRGGAVRRARSTFENSASAPADDNGRNEATGRYRTVTVGAANFNPWLINTAFSALLPILISVVLVAYALRDKTCTAITDEKQGKRAEKSAMI